jgi:hypothetical protein
VFPLSQGPDGCTGFKPKSYNKKSPLAMWCARDPATQRNHHISTTIPSSAVISTTIMQREPTHHQPSAPFL